MGLSIGLVGLPNVGKSTTFNSLTKQQKAQAANYPFCTIEPNKAIVGVPDKRLEMLANIVKPQRVIQSQIEFCDIAGLVKGASQGEGLGNKFLSNIRETEVILHVVRCFEDKNITHVEGKIDPVRDVEIIGLELLFSDIEQIERKIECLKRQVKGNKKLQASLNLCEELKMFAETGNQLRSFKRQDELFENLKAELRLLSAKEIIYACNVDEQGMLEDNIYTQSIKKYAQKNGNLVLKFCAKIEEELVGLNDEERAEMLKGLGIEEGGLEQILRFGFEKLGLISYFTVGVQEVRAWTIEKGWLAPKAAGVIHNDFEKGFIRAEVIAYEDFIVYGGEAGVKKAGKMRLKGKEYEVKDGDVIHFRFNV